MSSKPGRQRRLPQVHPLRLAIFAALSAAPVLQAATVPPNSPIDASEFLVNSAFTAGQQNRPRVARDAAGDFVVVWQSQGQVSSGSSYDVYAQCYNAAGQPQSSEFLVNTFTAVPEINPAVAMDAAGDFVVAWDSYKQISSAASYDVYARQFNAACTAIQTSQFLVNTFTSGKQLHSAVAMDAAGDFVIAWQSYGQASSTSHYDIYARQFTSAGIALHSEFLVNTVISNLSSDSQTHAAVAMDAAGDFVVTWQRRENSSYIYDVYARQYNMAGTAASTFLVNTFTSGQARSQAVAMDAVGDFVVAWQSYGQAVPSSSRNDIYARQFSAAGSAVQVSEFLVDTVTSGVSQLAPAVAMDAAGDFAVTWETYGGSIYDIDSRQYTSAGAAVQASAFLASTVTSIFNAFPAVAMDAAGDFVAVWQSHNHAATASNYDIYARRYQGPETVDLGATLAASPGSVSAGGSFSLTLGVNNKTAATTSFSNATINAGLGLASGISAVFTIPSGATLGTTSGTNWACGTVSDTSLSCNYSGSLAAATAASGLTLNFKAPTSTGTLSIPVSVSSTQQQSGSDNSASATVTVKAASTSGGGGSSGGGGAFGLFSLALFSLSLLRRRRSKP